MSERSILKRITDRLRLYQRKYLMGDFYSATPETPKAVVKALKINRNLPGHYYEFGLYKGYSFYKAVKASPTSVKHFAFDSFEGLPESNEGGKFSKGQYTGTLEYVKENLRKRGALRDNTFFYKGFYNESLTHDLQQELKNYLAKVVLIDCDLYSSTVPVLAFIKPMLQRGTLILFDDWNCFNADDTKGERKATREFLRDNSEIKLEESFSFGWHGQAFKVISV